MSKDIKFSIKDIPKQFKPVFEFLKRYMVFIFIIVILLTYSFVVFKINTFSRSEPSEDAVLEKLQTVKRPKLDQTAVQKLEDLEDQNVEVQTIFQDARNNPFTE